MMMAEVVSNSRWKTSENKNKVITQDSTRKTPKQQHTRTHVHSTIRNERSVKLNWLGCAVFETARNLIISVSKTHKKCYA